MVSQTKSILSFYTLVIKMMQTEHKQSEINMDYDYPYHDFDHLDAVIFRDEKSYEECDTKVDMSWAEHYDPFFPEDEWCILQKIMITNALKETKECSYYPYRIFTEVTRSNGLILDAQKMTEELNSSIKDRPEQFQPETINGCSNKVLCFLWGSIEGKKDISGWERIHRGKVELRPDGRHFNPIESDPFSVNIIFADDDQNWINFDSVITPFKWHSLSEKDFTQGLEYNPFTDQTCTPIDWEY